MKALIIIGVIAVAVVLLMPGLAQSLISMITGEPLHCSMTPYSTDCLCNSDERKVSVPWGGLPRWYCETLDDLLLDPDSPTFEQDAIDFAGAYLDRHCGSVCTDLSCSSGTIEAVYGWGVEGFRLANIECRVELEPGTGFVPWRMNFLVESETGVPVAYEFFKNYCYDPAYTNKCEPPMDIIPYSPTASIGMGSGWPEP